jgi:hypothetical protein
VANLSKLTRFIKLNKVIKIIRDFWLSTPRSYSRGQITTRIHREKTALPRSPSRTNSRVNQGARHTPLYNDGMGILPETSATASASPAFDERKAADAAVFFLRSEGKEMPALKLSTLLYLAERLSLQRYGNTITGDDFVAMSHGPALAATLRLLNGETDCSDGYWKTLIALGDGENVGLAGESGRERAPEHGLRQLSDSDVEVLGETLDKYGHIRQGVLRGFAEENLPEWKDPHGAYLPHARECERFPLLSSRRRSHRYDLASGLESVQVVSPRLHHGFPFFQEGSPVVCAAVRVWHGVSKLQFNRRLGIPQDLLQYGRRHSPEAVSGHLFLGVIAQITQGFVYRAIADWLSRLLPGKDIFMMPGERMQVFQYRQSLTRQRDNMGSACFRSCVCPLSLLHINLWPHGLPQLYRPHESKRREFQRRADNVRTLIASDCPHQCPDFIRVRDCGEVLCPHGR